MDFPRRDELIVNRFKSNIKAIEDYLAVDSLEYLTIDEMMEAVSEADSEKFCNACFSGDYPSPVDLTVTKEMYEI